MCACAVAFHSPRIVSLAHSIDHPRHRDHDRQSMEFYCSSYMNNNVCSFHWIIFDVFRSANFLCFLPSVYLDRYFNNVLFIIQCLLSFFLSLFVLFVSLKRTWLLFGSCAHTVCPHVCPQRLMAIIVLGQTTKSNCNENDGGGGDSSIRSAIEGTNLAFLSCKWPDPQIIIAIVDSFSVYKYIMLRALW